MAKIELKGIAKSFGRSCVLDGLGLEIKDGEFFCLVGPSGCGKTTLLNLIAGLEFPDAGEVRLDGRDVTALGPRERDVAMVFQSYALYPHLTVRENIAFPLRVRKTPEDEIARRVAETAQTLGLGALLDRRPRQLSGGQQQRVALGRALIRRPAVFLLDEPLSNLDAKLRTQMRLELKRLHRDFPVTTVYVTHDQEEALSLSDRMAILKDGKIQQIATPLEAYERPANVFVAQFIGKPLMNLLKGSAGDGAVKVQDGLLPLKGASPRGPVLLGVRPEHLSFVPEGQGDLRGTVEVVEPMGPETWVEVACAGERVVVKTQGRAPAAPGLPVALRWDAEKAHLFDPETENRLS